MEIPKEKIDAILGAAVQAPSGDNSQPWRFKVTKNSILVINAGDSTESIFNYRQIVNHIGLGACIENISIFSENLGYRTEITYFPESSNETIVAEIHLHEDSSLQNDLADLIEKRSTNRKTYLEEKISSDILSELSSASKNIGGKIVFISKKEEIEKAAYAVSAGEEIVLSSKSIHTQFFSHITWTKEEDALKHGFYINTFEFTKPQKKAFTLFRNWNVLRLFLPFGIAKFISRDMEKVYRTSAAFGAILMPSYDTENCVKAGRAFQRMWLIATKHNLALQPTTGVCFFTLPILDGNFYGLFDSLVNLLKERHQILTRLFGATKEETILLVFRIGYAAAPSSTTTRFAPKVE